MRLIYIMLLFICSSCSSGYISYSVRSTDDHYACIRNNGWNISIVRSCLTLEECIDHCNKLQELSRSCQ